MKRILFLSCMLTLAVAASVAAAPKAPEAPLEFKGSQKTVMFPHVPHAKVECVTCHHLIDGKESYAKCGSSGCHDDLVGKKGEKSLYYVVHSKRDLKHTSCLMCHTKVVEEKPDLKKDLLGCAKSKCHP